MNPPPLEQIHRPASFENARSAYRDYANVNLHPSRKVDPSRCQLKISASADSVPESTASEGFAPVRGFEVCFVYGVSIEILVNVPNITIVNFIWRNIDRTKTPFQVCRTFRPDRLPPFPSALPSALRGFGMGTLKLENEAFVAWHELQWRNTATDRTFQTFPLPDPDY